MARRSRAAPPASVTWRDGVHLTGTPIWCDARRRRDVCFVSSCDRIGRAGHGQLIATPMTLALVNASDGGHLGVPLHRRFTLGTVRLELIASGRGPGAAALWADIAGKTVLYAGAIRTQAADCTEGAEVRACDALVVGADHAPRKQPALEKTIDRTADWARKELAAGRRPVIVVATALDGLEIAQCLASAKLELAASRAIRESLQRVHAVGASAPAPLRTLQLATLGKHLRTSIVMPNEAFARLGAHTVQPAWQSAASRDELLGWIESTRAKEVYVTGHAAEDIAKLIGARVLGPPQQMMLFEQVRA